MKEEPLNSFSPVDEEPDCFTAAKERNKCAAKFPVSEATETQEPESADTAVGNARFIPQGQVGCTTGKCATIHTRTDEIQCSDSNGSGSWKECDRNERNTHVLSGQVVDSERQNTHKDSYTTTSTVLSDGFCKDASDANSNCYQVNDSCERLSASKNGSVAGQPSLSPGERDVFTCDICREVFVDKRILRTHVQQHLLKCDICHKTCRDANGLEVHYRTHTGERPYCCDTCGQTFSCSDQLRLHSLQHTMSIPTAAIPAVKHSCAAITSGSTHCSTRASSPTAAICAARCSRAAVI
ncbi:zinc finger protein 317-like isoform X2 [Schistocerca gregaria]|nr:zinc finger protein 317-like isoform X2 [Schistocerca gregaria]